MSKGACMGYVILISRDVSALSCDYVPKAFGQRIKWLHLVPNLTAHIVQHLSTVNRGLGFTLSVRSRGPRIRVAART